MKCGIVILNYNAYDFTCNIIKKVLSNDLIDKVVLIDDNSDDNFDLFVRAINNKKVKYIKNKKVLEYAKGNNIGLKYLKSIGCKYAFVSKPDVVFEYETIEKILSFLDKNQNYGIASCVGIVNGNLDIAKQFWTLPTFTETLLESIFIGRKYQESFNKFFTKQNLKKEITEYSTVEVVNGAFLGCNLEILEKVGYFDEIPMMFYEENNLSYKLKVKGYKVAYLKNCTYEHQQSLSIPNSPNLFNIFLYSKRYYCKIYLNIGMIKVILLHIFEFMGKTEIEMLDLLSKKERKVHSKTHKGEIIDDRKKAKHL